MYSALATRMSTSESGKIKLVVINQETLGRPLDPGLLKNEKLKERLAPLVQETVDDYIAKNREVHQLSRDLNIKLPYIFFRKEDEEIFKEPDGWDIFAQKYPGAFGYIAFSAVGFNSEMDQALVYVSRYCGRLCGSGQLVVLTKHDGVWDPRVWLTLMVA